MGFSRTRWCAYNAWGFTLWEILLIIVVISIGLLAIVSLLTYGINFVQKSREKVIAINLAREWIEAVYQIRDTNRQRRAGRKDQCRLKADPLVDESAAGCEDDLRMISGSYILEKNTVSGQEYFLLTGYTTDVLDLGWGIDTWALRYALCRSGGLRTACPGYDFTSAEWRYFREIRGYGLFAKDVTQTGGQEILCDSGMDLFICGSPSAKEFRFCSKVIYVWYGTWEVELCGAITNFVRK